MQIVEARGRADLRHFIYFPQRLYRNDSLWAPPLWSEERETFSARNPVLARSEFACLLAVAGRKVLGRILAYVDREYNRYYGSRIGLFGSFECIEDEEVAAALLTAAEDWLLRRGMERVRGPINPISECWGFIIEGFERSPMFMAPYNPPHYNRFVTARGYEKVKDLLVYEADSRDGYRIPERFVAFRSALLRRRPSIRIRRLDMRRLSREAEAICRISNEAIRDNWGYVPLDAGELEVMFGKLRPIADPDAIWFVEDAGEPVGYCLGFPDLNQILRRIRGRLFPFGFLTLLTRLKKVRDFRLFGLAVLPRYQGMGLDVLLYMSLYEALAPRGVRLEANYILEDNPRIRNALTKLGMVQTTVYRVYEKPIEKTKGGSP
jgi:GNAT superfamily N-acetyltransferase